MLEVRVTINVTPHGENPEGVHHYVLPMHPEVLEATLSTLVGECAGYFIQFVGMDGAALAVHRSDIRSVVSQPIGALEVPQDAPEASEDA